MYDKNVEYIIKWFEWDTLRFIDLVLNDSIEDPEYSAITCCNRIIVLINLKSEYREKFKSIDDFLKDVGYKKNIIKKFMKKRDEESKYYHGEVLSL